MCLYPEYFWSQTTRSECPKVWPWRAQPSKPSEPGSTQEICTQSSVCRPHTHLFMSRLDVRQSWLSSEQSLLYKKALITGSLTLAISTAATTVATAALLSVSCFTWIGNEQAYYFLENDMPSRKCKTQWKRSHQEYNRRLHKHLLPLRDMVCIAKIHIYKYLTEHSFCGASRCPGW